MYTICPKCQYQRKSTDQGDANICPACGLIFSKWMKRRFARKWFAPVSGPVDPSTTAGLFHSVTGLLLHVDERIKPLSFWGRVILFVLFAIWGWQFIQMDFISHPAEVNQSFMHNINLVFHEAGHIIFSPFGWLMTKLGGTLGQLLMPLIVMLAFLIKHHNNFGAAIGLWWLGQSLIDCAPYIDDALDQRMLLLGGVTGADRPGYHDWNSILGNFDVLERHRTFATMADTTGSLLILLAIAWGGAILYRQYHNLER